MNPCVLAAFVYLLASLILHAEETAATAAAPIPFSEIGAKATADYKGDAIGITATADGATLRTGFQKLAGMVTREGLRLTSTEAEGGSLQLTASAVGRGDPSTIHSQPSTLLTTTGSVVSTSTLVTFTRPRLTEEYSVSADGVRQDFIVPAAPAGSGELSVELALSGATAEAAADGAKLTLAGSGRVLAYSRLQVTDAQGQVLAATLAVLSPTRLVVQVDDTTAAYPVRIDPTFSDADWVSLNPSIPGANNTVHAAVADASGNLYVGGDFSLVGTTVSPYIAQASVANAGSYVNDLSLSPAPATIAGNAFITGGQLQLTANTTSQYGTLLVPDLNTGSTVNGFTASFTLNMNGFGAADAADGFSFNFGNPASYPSGYYNWETSVAGGGALSFNVVTWVTNVVSIRYNGSTLASFSSPNSVLYDGTNQTVSITYTSTGGLSATYRGQTLSVSAATLTAAGYAGPQSGHRFLLGARTGARTAQTSIANLSISTSTPAPEIAVFDGIAPPANERTDNVGTFGFGSVNTGSSSASQTFTIKNTGTGSLTLGTITLTGADLGQFSITQPLSSSLAANATTTFTATFSPSATGARSGVINIASNDADENPFEINVGGNGVVPMPTVTSINPASGSTLGGTSVTITGTNLTGATGVTIGGTAATSFSVVNATTITAATPAGTTGAKSVVVTTPGGSNSANSLYTYVAAPTVTAIAPNTGTTTGGTSVTITGTNLTGATGVAIGGTAATGMTVVNATTITAITPAGTAGTASVQVTSAGGTNAANTLYTFVAPPTVTLSTASLPSTAATLTLTGTNFSTTPGNNTVAFTPAGTGTVTAATVTSLTVTSLSGLTQGALSAVVTTNGLSSGPAVQVATVVAPGPGDLAPLNLNIVGSSVLATAVQPDGKTIIGGSFTSVLDQPRNNIARLNADGTLDAGFNPIANGGAVYSVTVQADGQILLGGQFTSVGGTGRNRIARVAANGTLDAGFNPDANGDVYSVAVQADGQILLGGQFTSVVGTGRNRIARVAANGTLDAGFNPNANGTVLSVAVQADGQILLGGLFTSVGGTTRNSIARVAANGTLDAGFNPNPNVNSAVRSVVVQADGQILLGGQFNSVGGTTRNCIARVAADGTLDAGFNPNANGTVYSVAVQADGQILLGGGFTSVGGTGRSYIARVAANGTLDAGFDPILNDLVFGVAVQADGKVLLGGGFTSVGGTGRRRFARLHNDTATQSLTIPSASRVQWLRGGASPEVEPVSFELSTDGGTIYSALGAGTRISGGWERTGLTLPASGHIRARGRTTGGYYNCSSGLVEAVASFSVAVAPTVTNVTPANGSTSGGTSVTITGTNLTGATAVTFGGTAAASFTVVNSTTITATTPARAAGAVSVLVTTPGGTNAANTLFTYSAAGPLAALEAYLKASNTGANDNFGYSVAVSGDTAVIGAPFESSNATGVNGNQANNSASGSGAAYVFTRSGGSWTQQAYLKASNTGANDNFGYSVAVSGDTAVIGAYGEDSSATGVSGNQADNSAGDAGAAYVFTRSGSTWTQQAYLKAINTGASDFFGISVAVSSDTVVIGAPYEASSVSGVNGNQADNSALFSGAAYVFTRSGNTWTQQAYLKASNTGVGDWFGRSVAVSGDTAVIGAYNEGSNASGVGGDQTDNSAFDSGAAYVFTRSAGVWTQQAYLKASNTEAGDNFGYSVSVSGDTAVISAKEEDSSASGVGGNQADNSAMRSGAAYVFTRSGTTWTQQAYLKASNTEVADLFGHSVAVSGDTVVIAAIGEDSNASGVGGNQADNSVLFSGAAYVFTRSGSTWTQQAYLKASNAGASDLFGISVAVSGGTAVIGSYQEDSSATGVGGNQADNSALESGAAYIFTGLGPTAPVPTVANITPATGSIMGGTSVTITGTGFTGATGVTIGGNAATVVSVVNDTTITCTAPFNAPGTASVIVTTPAGTNVANTLYTYVILAPDIAVSQAGMLSDGVGSVSFGTVTTGDYSSPLTFTISNLGTAELTSLMVTKDGADAADFTVSIPFPTNIPVGSGTVTFTVGFAPSTSGSKTAAIHIASNVMGAKNPFDITLTGTGQTPTQAAVNTALTAAGLTGPNAALDATPYQDGVENLLKYAFNMNLSGPDSAPMPPGGSSGLPGISAQPNGASSIFRYEFLRRLGSGLIYTPQKTSDLALPNSWVPLTDSPTVIPIDANWERVIYEEPYNSATTLKCFGRVQVSLP